MGSLHARCAARDPRANLAGIVDTNEESGRSLAERLETKYLRSVDEALEGILTLSSLLCLTGSTSKPQSSYFATVVLSSWKNQWRTPSPVPSQ